MSVKEVLMSLVDDDLVETDKIGVSTYYWSLISKVGVKLKKKCESLTTELENISKDIEAKKNHLAESIIIKSDSVFLSNFF